MPTVEANWSNKRLFTTLSAPNGSLIDYPRQWPWKQHRLAAFVSNSPRTKNPLRLPLSPAKQRTWFVNQFDTTSAAYNIPLAIRLSGRLDVAAIIARVSSARPM